MSAQAPAENAAKHQPKRVLKSSTELIAGLLCWCWRRGIFGTLISIRASFQQGPGMCPKITALASPYSARPSVQRHRRSRRCRSGNGADRFVFGAVLVFAATVRGLGLGVAGPLSVLISALADRDTRLIEIIPFALLMTAISALLFKWLLGLPIPILPFLLGY